MTPEEYQRLISGQQGDVNIGSYRPRIRAGTGPGTPVITGGSTQTPLAGNIDLGNIGANARRTGQMPASMQELQAMYQQAKSGMQSSLLQPGGLFKNQAGQYRQAAGGKTGAILSAVGTAMEDPVAGVVSAPIGIGAGMLANTLTTQLTKGMMAGPAPLKAAGMALRYLAPAYVGSTAQQASARAIQGITGSAPSAGTDGGLQAVGGGLFGLGGPLDEAKIPLPWGGSIALGEKVKLERQAEFNRRQRTLDQKANLALLQEQANLQQRNDLEFARAMGQIQNQNTITQMNAMAPIIERAQRNELAGQQALLNTQGAIYQKLGRMAGMFQIAERGMAESGALARTMAANSPYNAAVLPAPQINFG